MKLYITTNIDLDLSELPEFFIEPTVQKTKAKLKTKFNPYFNEVWGDFNYIRTLSPLVGYDARCYVTSHTRLFNLGIDRKHIGMYDMVDNDGILDFYAGIPDKLDRRAKKNGFKTNEAWMIVHEICHGLCQKVNRHDATHTMEAQGRLKELYFECYNELLKEKISLLEQFITIWKRFIKN